MLVIVVCFVGLQPLLKDFPVEVGGIMALIALVLIFVLPVYGGYLLIKNNRLAARNGNPEHLEKTVTKIHTKFVRPVLRGSAIGVAATSATGSIVLVIAAVIQPESGVGVIILPLSAILIGATLLSVLYYTIAVKTNKLYDKKQYTTTLVICTALSLPAVLAIILSVGGIV